MEIIFYFNINDFSRQNRRRNQSSLFKYTVRSRETTFYLGLVFHLGHLAGSSTHNWTRFTQLREK